MVMPRINGVIRALFIDKLDGEGERRVEVAKEVDWTITVVIDGETYAGVRCLAVEYDRHGDGKRIEIEREF